MRFLAIVRSSFPEWNWQKYLSATSVLSQPACGHLLPNVQLSPDRIADRQTIRGLFLPADNIS
jgi:hypothetical protein